MTMSEAAGPGEIFVPDMPRRTTMNAILVGSIGVTVLGLAVPYLAFFVPQGSGGGGGGLIAKDALGNDVTVAGWKSSHQVHTIHTIHTIHTTHTIHTIYTLYTHYIYTLYIREVLVS